MARIIRWIRPPPSLPPILNILASKSDFNRVWYLYFARDKVEWLVSDDYIIYYCYTSNNYVIYYSLVQIIFINSSLPKKIFQIPRDTKEYQCLRHSIPREWRYRYLDKCLYSFDMWRFFYFASSARCGRPRDVLFFFSILDPPVREEDRYWAMARLH